MSNRVREEGASEGIGKNSKGKANNNPGACVGLGLGLKARPEGWGWGPGMMLNSFPDYSMWDLFCLRLSRLGRKQWLQIWREECLGSRNSQGPREEWSGLLPW